MDKMPGPDVGYLDLVDENTRTRLQKESENPSKDFYPLRPSSMGDCARALYHKLMEFQGKESHNKAPITPELDRIFKFGHLIEGLAIKEFRSVEYFQVKYTQQAVDFFEVGPDKKLIEGSIDWCVYAPETRGVLDAKSKKDNFSSWSKTSWSESAEKFASMKSVIKVTDKLYYIDDLDAFLEENNDIWLAPNFYQLNLYANSEFLKKRGVDHGSIIQINKNDCRWRELRFRPSVTVYEKCRAKYDNIAHAASIGNADLVPKEYSLGSSKCSDCFAAYKCWPNKNARQAWFDTWPYKKWPDRTSKLGETGEELERLFARYKETENSEKEKKRIEQLITLIMNENEIQKVELDDASVYEMKALKTDGLVIRRTKK